MIRTWRLVAVILLAVAGAAIAMHLSIIHINHIRTGIPSSCNFNESFNCDAVNTSKWSEIAGVPVAHLGMLTYLVMAGLALAALGRAAFRVRAHAYLFVIATWSALFSAYMAFISLVVIKSVCVWCASLYGINILLLAFLAGGGLSAAYGIFEHIAADLGWMKKPAGALLVLAIVAVVAGSSWHLRQYLNEARSNAPRPENMIINTAGSPSFGPANAPVTIIEISDFECPFCRKASVTLQGVVDAYTGKVRVVFKNFPLDQACNRMIKRPFHENACAAAAASMCASQNGYFWPFAKKLFNSALDRQAILDTAASFGFGQAEFETCMASGSAVDAVKLDIEDCIKAGVDSVPVFLVNGRKLVGAQTPATFRAVIDEELAASR